MKQVITDGFLVNPGDLSWQELERFGSLTVHDVTAPDQLLDRVRDAEVIYSNRVAFPAEVLKECKNLKYMGLLATGFNTIHLPTATAQGIVVSNVPAYSTYSVAQTTIALLLEIAGNTSGLNAHVKTGNWKSYTDKTVQALPLTELWGKTIGLIGMGGIGKVVADICLAMGMNVLCYRRNPDKSLEHDRLRFCSLDELAAKSDIISLHCPLSDSTQGLINKNYIAKMKDNAIIINTARGAIMDEQAVSDALDSGKLYGVGVDVFTVEPAGATNPLLNNPRCVALPHVAWTPKDTRGRLLAQVIRNAEAFFAGTPINVVNP